LELEKERVKDALMKLKTPPHEELQPPRKINKWNQNWIWIKILRIKFQ